jgi:hypothetical protein
MQLSNLSLVYNKSCIKREKALYDSRKIAEQYALFLGCATTQTPNALLVPYTSQPKKAYALRRFGRGREEEPEVVLHP